jgi:hypothetical protein
MLVEKICSRMFLPDLTVANPKILKGGKLEKELADVIIPFRNSLVCFQIKSKTELKPVSQKTETDFARIKRRVEDGIGQLKTIQSALRDGLVSELTNRAGITLPIDPKSIQKIHGVVILELLGEEKFSVEEQTMISSGFTVRDQMPVHVFTLRDFDSISTEIDTIPDFIDYLEVRAALISRGQLLPFTQELDFLALYKTKHDLFRDSQGIKDTFLLIQDGFWKHHVETRKHIIEERNAANAPSYPPSRARGRCS